MFQVTRARMQEILRDFEVPGQLREMMELQRYHYERDNPDSREVRLIVKAEMEDAAPLVVRFKNEEDVTQALIESQCRFAQKLKDHGIETPRQYRCGGSYTKNYCIGGYEVTVTVEEFVLGEVKLVDVDLARKTGAVLARMHNIAQQQDLHVENQVLFDPFAHNDLFAFDVFLRLGEALRGEDRALFDRITDKYTEYMQALLPLKNQPRYAVQGDISQCNLYVTEDGQVGVFDFNRSGDNVLFCDAAMQAIFEARLMDYTETGEDLEDRLLEAFWAGYCAERPVSEEQWRWYGYLKAIIDAFWSGDIRWDEGSLLNAQAAGDDAAVSSWLKTIWQRLAGPESDL